MTPERWDTIKDVFEAALALEGDSRAAFLDQDCVGDPSLRAEVVELIASHERVGTFMAAAAFEPATRRGAEEDVTSQSGCRIGAYQTIREIGRGGMGTVYLAARADEEYRKQVAIKVVKRGMDTMDTEAVVSGFRKERQILAGLNHPHIAGLLDGGSTDDGLPYFVMDYIEGLSVDVYCDTRRLSIPQRLELFRTVCSAVQDAHQHGVIHRDLDNIVLMALRKEPARRYVSVEQFSDDIRRHLEGLPVIAHKDTLSYRTK